MSASASGELLRSGSGSSSSGELLSIEPQELQFPFELGKQMSCSLQLTNTSDNYVAFKVKTTHPKKYQVLPNKGVVMPKSKCDLTIVMREQDEAPPDMQIKDKFLIQSVLIIPNLDIMSESFEQECENVMERCKLGVVYIPQSLSHVEKFLSKLGPKAYSYADLNKFTSDFSESNKLGFGAYGNVYKGQIPGGVQVAVKVLVEKDVVEETFMAEVSTMGNASHRSLVKLYGYCFESNIKALVYEYMDNGSLDTILYKNNDNGIEWDKLYSIAIETAKGLAYLHDGWHEKIIHYDIKAANVLLDKNLFPKISDFGLAKLMKREVDDATLTRIRGTNGYNAPETWMPASRVTYKCDVYSFGMMLFEILGKRSNGMGDNWFPQQVWNKFKNEELEQLITDCGITEKDTENAKILAKVALLCAQYIPERRPSMSKVVMMLEKIIPVETPSYPFQFM
ncbi:hypothetical protein AQUCO_09100017v1 [Aquilegia coerulea]|uniref:non-specific serine/threonine protein kinase n=1 Tax=Aquilegia coerulea TaxID=218851 RepID=A0A2G5C5J6_AQUCA|nr:hypothetical protein AQUCO_09100017v1 [Aquilegia coerulea]